MGSARKACLYSFIAFLSFSALLAIFCVLFGKFGDFEGKVLVTTSVIAAASICALCCSAYSAKFQNRAAGTGGTLLAAAAAVMIIVGVWGKFQSPCYWKTTTVFSVFAVATAHWLAPLLVRLPATHRWLPSLTGINIFFLATVITSMIVWEANDAGRFKLAAVLAILAALETLVIPILSRVTRPIARPSLVLTQRDDGTYSDKNGRVYQVTKVSEQPLEATRP
jgi:hypothetical protein